MKPELQTLANLSRAYLSAMTCTAPSLRHLHDDRLPEDSPWFGAQNDSELVEMIRDSAKGERLPFEDLIGTPEHNQHKALHGLLCVMYFG